MAILELNLEKPALIEERRYPGSEGKSRSIGSSGGGGGKGKLLGLLVVLAGAATLAWKMKSSSGSDDYEHEEKYEHGPEPEIGGDEGGLRSKVTGVVGLTVALASVVIAARKVRS